MAKGDYINDLQSKLDGETLTIQPAAGEQYEIHSLVIGGACDVILNHGGITIALFSPDSTETGLHDGLKLEIDNGHYLQVTNTSGGSALFGCQGEQTK